MTSVTMEEIYMDLLKISSTDILLPQLPTILGNSDKKFKYLYSKLKWNTLLKQRQLTLFYAYHLGKFIEELPSYDRTLFKTKLSTHYFQGSVRSFHLFNGCEEQIFRTRHITFVTIKLLKSDDFRALCTLGIQ